MKAFNDLKTRGVADILIAVTDGLKGIGESLGTVFPATTLRTCIVHLIGTGTAALAHGVMLPPLRPPRIAVSPDKSAFPWPKSSLFMMPAQ